MKTKILIVCGALLGLFVVFTIGLFISFHLQEKLPPETQINSNAKTLLQSSDELLKKEIKEYDSIPLGELPSCIKSLNPERVYKTKEGIYIETWSFWVESGGIFIPMDRNRKYDKTTDPGYKIICDGIYYYKIKG